MIKFFRKIRQNLLSEGKTGKYLKYAIGEIILVVIGILIALQLNNLNDSHKINKEENMKQFLKFYQLNHSEFHKFYPVHIGGNFSETIQCSTGMKIKFYFKFCN